MNRIMILITVTTIVWIGKISAYNPPLGIPNPADYMGFDPLNIARPDPAVKCTSWANGNPHAVALGDDCDCYYIDNDAPGATNTSNSYGYPNKPRTTLPDVDLRPGSYVEIHAGNAYTFFPVRAKGKVDSLIWFVGKETPVVNLKIDIGQRSDKDSIRYIILDSLKITNRIDIRPRHNNHHFSNIVVRNCELDGGSTTGWTGIVAGSAPSATVTSLRNVVIYNCFIHHYGNIAAPDEECCFYNNGKSNNTWVLNNEISYAAEDGVAGGHSAAGTVHGYYIGDNYIHDNHVNGIDIKQDYDVVISHNRIMNHNVGSLDGSGPAQAVVLHYSGNTTGAGIWKNWPTYAMVINNVIDSAEEGIVTSYVTNLIVFGNIIKNIKHDSLKTYLPSSVYSPGMGVHIRSVRGNCVVEKNSLVNCDGGIKCADDIAAYNPATTYYKFSAALYNNLKYLCINDNSDAGIVGINPTNTSYWKPCTLSIKNNLILARNESLDCELQFQSTSYGMLFEIDRNDFWMSGDTARVRWGTSRYDLNNFRTLTGKCINCIEENPSTVSDTNLRLNTGSALIGAADAGYSSQLHHKLYNMFLNCDYDSTNIPNNSSYDIGAFQYKSSVCPSIMSVNLDNLKMWAVVEITGNKLDELKLFLNSDSTGSIVKDTIEGIEKRYYWFKMVPQNGK